MAETGIGFAFAKAFHPAMRHVGPVRSELGVPTTFNFLGPLSHPGGVKRQVIGVSDPAMAPRVAAVLAARNSHHALVVHGADRLDEITTTDVTRIYEVREGELIKDYEFDPRSVGIKLVNRADLVGGGPVENSEIMQRIFSGEDRGPRADIIALNTAAGLMVAGLADSFAEGVELSREVMADGSANSKVSQVQAFMASVRD
jgi:anthranilate phosphoribosyltransferase